MGSKPIDIQVFGRSLKVNCPPEQNEALNISVENLNQRLQELKTRTKVTNLEQLVLIVALNLCNELSQEKIKMDNYVLNTEKIMHILQNTIEKALIEQKNINNFHRIKFK